MAQGYTTNRNNIVQVGGAAITLGSKVSASSLPVVIASDQAAIPITDNSGSITVDNGGTFAVQATLSAETTKVIGTVNVAAGQTITVTQATGTNLHTVIDSGTLTAVTAITNALPAGTNLLGKVGIDQTTPGTTNKVSLGSDVVHTIIDSGTITAVTAITNALPVGTNSIGKISDITTSITPGVGALNLGKAEDAAHTTGDVGVMALAVRNDAGAVLAGSDGDYVPLTTDASGALRIDINGTISTNNSSTATLTAGSIFTGTFDDTLNFNEVRINVFASHASATDGLSIQQSSDSTNWDISDTYTIPANTGKTFAVPRQARYVRIVYTNGAINQSSFRLQTILNRTGTSASSQRTSDGYSNENDFEEIWSFNSVFNNSTWDRVRGATDAVNSTGTGLQTAQLIGQFDDVSPTVVTENQFGNVRMSSNRNLYGTIRDAAGNERGANVNSANQLLVTVDPGLIQSNQDIATSIASLLDFETNVYNQPLKVTVVQDNTPATIPFNSDSSAYEASRAIKSGAGNLYALEGYNSKTTNQFILVFDTATLPADGAIPKIIIFAPAQNNFSWSEGEKGRYFYQGIYVCNSSTAPTKTIGSADCWFNGRYL